MLGVPGTPHQGSLPALTADERALAATLKSHIAAIAAREHNIDHYDELEKSRAISSASSSAYGYRAGAAGIPVRRKRRSAISTRRSSRGGNPDPERHRGRRALRQRDRKRRAPTTMRPAPRRCSNLRGCCRTCRARPRQAHPPGPLRQRGAALFRHQRHGQPAICQEARGAQRARHRDVFARNARLLFRRAGQPEISRAVRPVFPDRGDFICVCRDARLAPAVAGRRCARSARIRRFRPIGGVAPGFIPGIAWSDHWAFASMAFRR